MELFGGTIEITGIALQLFVVFAIVLVGYLIGKIEIKGVNLGAAGVYIAALLFGAIFSADIHAGLSPHDKEISSDAFSIIENAGLIMFVGAVGMMAGPNFFRNLKKNFKSYILIGVVITFVGVLTSVACFYVGIGSSEVPAAAAEAGVSESQYMISMITGIMSGSLTSTPAFSASQATAASIVPADAAESIQAVVTTGHAIAYIFGVVGVVIFVQLVPRILNADMKKERELITIVDTGQDGAPALQAHSDTGQDETLNKKKPLLQIDSFGFAAFGLVVAVGIFIGMIRIPLSSQGLSGTTFSLTTTGGVLISGLIFAHFGHIGPISLKADHRMLEVFREFGLLFFLIGAGIPGGASFAEYFHPVYFVYGVIITVVPMITGYFLAKKLLKLPLLNSLGSITGGMTSTPALGALIKTSGTDDVASSYAATYPFALVCVVIASQFMILLLG